MAKCNWCGFSFTPSGTIDTIFNNLDNLGAGLLTMIMGHKYFCSTECKRKYAAAHHGRTGGGFIRGLIGIGIVVLFVTCISKNANAKSGEAAASNQSVSAAQGQTQRQTWTSYDVEPPQAVNPRANISVRDKPGRAGNVLFILPENSENVRAIALTREKETIDGISAPWAQVQDGQGRGGWAFSGYMEKGE